MMLSSRSVMCVVVYTSVWLITCVELLAVTAHKELRQTVSVLSDPIKSEIFHSWANGFNLQDPEKVPPMRVPLYQNKPHTYNSWASSLKLQEDEQLPSISLVLENSTQKTTSGNDKPKQNSHSNSTMKTSNANEEKYKNQKLAKKGFRAIIGNANDNLKTSHLQGDSEVTFNTHLKKPNVYQAWLNKNLFSGGSVITREFSDDLENSKEAAEDQQSSHSTQIFRRQIFTDDNHGDSEGNQQPLHESVIGKNKNQGSEEKEEFNGFPKDFSVGLKPFKFQENSKGQDSQPNLGFVDFPDPANFVSFASSLGGLDPFPPLASSDNGHEDTSSDEKKPPIINNSGHVKQDFESLDSLRHLPGQANYVPLSNTKANERNQHLALYSQEKNSGRSSQTFFRSSPLFDNSQERSSGFSPDNADDHLGRTSTNKPESRARQTSSTEDGTVNGQTLENFSSFKDFDEFSGHGTNAGNQRQSRFPQTSLNKHGSLPKSGDNNDQQFSSSPPSTFPKPSFHDADHLPQGEPQNFVPVAHFNPNGHFPYPQFGSFRPIHSPDSSAHRGPPVRNFRQISAPQFFIASGGDNFDGNGFFDTSGPGDFGRGPAPLDSNFDEPRRFSQPQFHFGQQQRPSHHHHHQHSSGVRDNHHSNFHGDDSTNHHPSATNLLGSGNFGIIRGGIFADDENPPHSFRAFHGGHGGDDFFHGFRDFQPYGGSLNNALSVNSQNIQNAGSKTQTVTAQTEAPIHKNSSLISDNMQSQSHTSSIIVPITTVKPFN